MESFRNWGLQGYRVEATPSEACPFGEAVMSLVSENKIRQLFITRDHSERDGIDSMSSGSMSSVLGEMWRQGYPVSPQWEGELELDADVENENQT